MMKRVIVVSESQMNKLRESFISEDVFMSSIKGNKVNLTYNKNNTGKSYNKGNMNSQDMLNTTKMDQNNSDTFIVPLKGGINSYNITSIKGMEVMHYFKNKANNQKTNVKVDGSGKQYELDMEDRMYKEFEEVFLNKVGNVIADAVSRFGKNDFTEISIYPVPSSSNFNTFMCSQIAGRCNINGLPTRAIDKRIFEKDLSDLQKDTDFIEKNSEYFQGKRYDISDKEETHMDAVEDTMRKFKNKHEAQDTELIERYNKCVSAVVMSYYQNVSSKTLAKNYQKLVDVEQELRQRLSGTQWDKTFKQIKYAKGPSVEKRSEEIWARVAEELGKTYIWKHKIPIVKIMAIPFQIKNLANDVRMGLKNYYKVQDNMNDEIERIKNTIFVIFDDNVSGGATLSDICYQCKKLGINYIVPITFGEMATKWTNGVLKINSPKEWNY